MSAKQVSSGYILWKTGPEPVRHSHRERARLLTAAPAPEWSNLIQVEFHQAGNTPPSAVWGEQAPSASAHSQEIPGDSVEKIRLPRRCLLQRDSREQCRRRRTAQAVSVPKKHLRNSVGKVRLLQAAPVPKKSPGQGRLAALVPKRPPGAAARRRTHRKTPGRSSGLPGVLLCRGDYFFR